jgi:GDP/UDP-N,N'-diacetylbacillosamine 2-epimerase (hydrolysing)
VKKICVITGTRSEYGLFRPIMEAIVRSDALQLQTVVTTMHLAANFGETYKEIEADGFTIDEKIENLICSDSDTATVKSSGMALILLSDALARLRPDVVLLLGDRYETFAAATAAMLMKIPIAHIHGGERTEGAIDEQIRHAITKMAYLHFASTEAYRQRIITMGEDPERVIYSGAPGVDNIMRATFTPPSMLSGIIGWDVARPYTLVIYHPETYSERGAAQEIDRILELLETEAMRCVFVYANADHGGQTINEKVEAFVRRDTEKYAVVKNLSMVHYLSLLSHAQMLIGNSSSGIIEAPSLKVPVVNIGDRQKGRIRAENVIDCTIDTLPQAIQTARSAAFRAQCAAAENPYGNGKATERIVRVLTEMQLQPRKPFHE